jgi:hypothetical protein
MTRSLSYRKLFSDIVVKEGQDKKEFKIIIPLHLLASSVHISLEVDYCLSDLDQ